MNSSEPPHLCPTCGSAIPPGAPGGFCPKCLFQAGDAPPGESGGEPGDSETVVAPPAGPAGEPRSWVRLGDYELLAKLAEGGMGIVYRARQLSLDRVVAVKTIKPGLLGNDVQVLRFRNEALAVANLDHPNIIPIYEVGQHEGCHYFSMKFVEGGSLAAQIHHGQWRFDQTNAAPQQEAMGRLMSKITRAVHHAHQRALLHRDLKPANVLVATDGEPQLTDFGLAKQLDRESSLTVSEAVIGTPAYMAPEQAAGKIRQITTASDIYSLGAILYELLTGQPPFRGLSRAQILHEVETKEPPRPRSINEQVDRDLETICLKAMEKEARHRYATAEAMADDLDRWLRGEPIAARPSYPWERAAKWAKRRPAQAALVGLIGLFAVVAALLWAFASGQRQRALAASDQRELKEIEALFDQGDSAIALARLAAVLRANPRNTAAATRFMAVLAQRSFAFPVGSLAHPDEILMMHFQPQGRLLVTASRDPTVRIWNVATCQLAIELHGHQTNVFCARFSADGRKIVTGSQDRTARLWEASTGTELARLSDHESAVRWVEFSPDDTRVLTVASNVVRIWDAGTGALMAKVVPGEGIVRSARFSRDGTRIATGGHDGSVRFWDAAALQPLGLSSHESSVLSVRLAPDGRRVASASDDQSAHLWDPLTGEVVILQHPAPVASTEFSPTGRLVATACADGMARVWDSQSGAPLPYTLRHERPVICAVFSPDGLTLLTAGDDGTARLWDVGTGKALAEPIRHSRYVESALFSPDGVYVATSAFDHTVRLWQVPPPAPPVRPLPRLNGHWIEFSPDGRLALSVSNQALLWWDVRTATPVAAPLPFQGELTHLQFSSDGRRLLVVSGNEILVRTALPGPASSVRLRCAGPVETADFSLDSRWIVSVSGLQAEVWDARGEPSPRWTLTHADLIESARFSPDARRMITASRDHTARVWDVRAGRFLTLTHTKAVLAGCFSPDGERVVTASEDQTVCVWDARSGQPLFEPIRHQAGVNSAAFSPDGTRIVSASADRKLRIWDALNGLPLTDVLRTDEPVWGARFTTSGRWVVTRSGVAWEVPAAPAPAPPWLADLAEALAGQRVGAAGLAAVQAEEFTALRRRLLALTSRDPFASWARWFVADPLTRTISPSAEVLTSEYAQRRIAESTLESLREAVRLSPTNRLAREQLARLLAAESE